MISLMIGHPVGLEMMFRLGHISAQARGTPPTGNMNTEDLLREGAASISEILSRR